PYVYSDITLPINSHLVLRTDTPYHHFHTGRADIAAINRLREELGLSFSAVDAHCSLLLPQLGTEYLKAAFNFAARIHCPVVMSDEGPLSLDWMGLDKSFDIMCFALEQVVKYSHSYGVKYAMELHNALTAQPDYMVRLLNRFGPDEIGVNFDTGNSFLAGNDPVEYLRQIADRVIHVHIKDIPRSQLDQRGKVTGTRVGVAAGDGEVDLPSIIDVLKNVGYDGVLSVECDTFDQAKRSLVVAAGNTPLIIKPDLTILTLQSLSRAFGHEIE
ncbi:MAG: sugar phosphate isomerase/epimerase family protein, partial [Planctomycetota bacterium]